MSGPEPPAGPSPTGEGAGIFPLREERHPSALVGWLQRRRDGSAADFSIVDLSYGGCRLTTDADLKSGERVRLFVSGRGAIEAQVCWRRGESIGLTFAIDPAADRTERKAERLRTRLSVTVRRAGRRGQWIDAHDISAHGCCLSFVDVPRAGDLLFVQFPGLEPIEARVRWAEGHRAGIEFARPIHPAVFDLLLERWKAIAP